MYAWVWKRVGACACAHLRDYVRILYEVGYKFGCLCVYAPVYSIYMRSCLFANMTPKMQHPKVFQLQLNSNLAPRRSEVDMLLPNTCERRCGRRC